MNPVRPGRRTKVHLRQTAAVLAGGILTAVLAGLAATPAAADDGPAMQLSSDGIHFTSSQEPAVFPDLAGLVPGETRPGTVWVRNAGADPAAFDLAVRSGAGSAVLTNSLELLAGSPGHAAVTVPLAGPGQCRNVLQGWVLAAGETLRIDLALGLVLAATNATRRESAGVELIFLVQGLGGGAAVSACSTPSEPSGVGHQGNLEMSRALQSNVVGNDQRPTQLLAFSGVLFLFVAIAKRRRNP
ncbi:hypothetical protein ACQCSX_18730 [Pseudarthrobacter sp. P1]|uniref:hypothetical protein n=1 Tax=Pseudarthrobacter sp. P1 TaxID=3418418 RepID=UPI003CEED4C7